DRVLASRLGFAAVNELLAGNTRVTVGLRGNEIKTTPIEEAISNKEIKLSPDLLEMAEIL
ncbi:MAG: 6-phosphofructokinase, partial [Sphingobacterium siyangense]